MARQEQEEIKYVQWKLDPDGDMRPSPVVKDVRLADALPPGVYDIKNDMVGPYLKRRSLVTDDVIDLVDSPMCDIVAGINSFWGKAEKYRRHGMVHKRGILLFGAPGCGKTVMANVLSRDMVARGGIVIFVNSSGWCRLALNTIRQIEPNRHIVIVMEEIDSIIENEDDESELLSILDGDNQVNGVVYIATTNYPEKLGARLVNRPSRFDEVVQVPLPSLTDRRRYLKQVISASDERDCVINVERWAQDTEGFSIAHLKELVVAVLILDQDYRTVLKRLKCMMDKPEPVPGFIPSAADLEEILRD